MASRTFNLDSSEDIWKKTYNGLDIVVGDWVAMATSGLCWKINSITAKTINSVTCVVEDWLRYNTFRASTGNGAPSTGSAVVFSLNEKGTPKCNFS